MEKQKRPIKLAGRTTKIPTGCGSMYVTVTENEGSMFEVFGILGKAGGCAKCQAEALTRCITLGLRYGIPPQDFIRQLSGLACPMPILVKGERISSCPDAIARVMAEFLRDSQGTKTITEVTHGNATVRPDKKV